MLAQEIKIRGECNMKLKKWLLAIAAFAVTAVVCAVAAGAENYHAYIGFQT